MFLIGNLVTAVATILQIVVTVYYWLLIIRVVLSWVPVNRSNQLVILLENVTDPLLNLFHRYIPQLRQQSQSLGFDFTPIVAFLALYFIDIFLIESLFDLGQTLTP
ncbi:MAG: YggT family protein [Candidatus Marinimicrobia bacterium]|nr:YggT family protein [Candidatus Neomarinimicrobiota bacterium]MCF7829133.1 YggT family protein [Candidatus Neomarinimicrobiota bacterium]MCF7881468.1 YggT family protein [Candidatus Neomarinimicrobiota bacterium]